MAYVLEFMPACTMSLASTTATGAFLSQPLIGMGEELHAPALGTSDTFAISQTEHLGDLLSNTFLAMASDASLAGLGNLNSFGGSRKSMDVPEDLPLTHLGCGDDGVKSPHAGNGFVDPTT